MGWLYSCPSVAGTGNIAVFQYWINSETIQIAYDFAVFLSSCKWLFCDHVGIIVRVTIYYNERMINNPTIDIGEISVLSSSYRQPFTSIPFVSHQVLFNQTSKMPLREVFCTCKFGAFYRDHHDPLKYLAKQQQRKEPSFLTNPYPEIFWGDGKSTAEKLKGLQWRVIASLPFAPILAWEKLSLMRKNEIGRDLGTWLRCGEEEEWLP